MAEDDDPKVEAPKRAAVKSCNPAIGAPRQTAALLCGGFWMRGPWGFCHRTDEPAFSLKLRFTRCSQGLKCGA